MEDLELWQMYEQEKGKIIDLNLSSVEYEKAIREMSSRIENRFRRTVTQLTSGSFEKEKDAEVCFDRVIGEKNPYFKIERQVKGRRLIDDKPVDKDKLSQHIIADRILHPTYKALLEGWTSGPIVVELKKSNVKLGPVISQVIEQRQTLYRSRYLNFTRISPMVYAVFPLDDVTHDLHSQMETQIILACYYSKNTNSIKFISPSVFILEIDKDTIKLNKNWSPTIRKGHRGPQK